MTGPPADANQPVHCVTCSDAAEPMVVVRLEGDTCTCRDEEGRLVEVMTDLVGDVREGSTLLVHAGTAIACLRSAQDHTSTETTR